MIPLSAIFVGSGLGLMIASEVVATGGYRDRLWPYGQTALIIGVIMLCTGVA